MNALLLSAVTALLRNQIDLSNILNDDTSVLNIHSSNDKPRLLEFFEASHLFFLAKEIPRELESCSHLQYFINDVKEINKY